VFEEGGPKDGKLDIVRPSDLAHQKTEHHLLDESTVKCTFHPDVDAIEYCVHCGRPVCYACCVDSDNGCSCEPCAEQAQTGSPSPLVAKTREQAPRSGPEAGAESPPLTVSQAMLVGPYVAWEYRTHMGRFNALLTTWEDALFRPAHFFRSVPLGGDYRSPLVYGLIWCLAALASGVAWKIMLHVYPRVLLLLEGGTIDLSLRLSRTYVFVVIGTLLSPLLALIVLLAACILYHVFVALLVRRHAGFEATLRVVCYSTGTNVFYFLPLLGGLIGGIWQLVLVTIGLKEVHRISFPLAVVTALVPYTALLIGGLMFMLWAITGNRFDVQNLLSNILGLLPG
jgi:hypothetical protein